MKVIQILPELNSGGVERGTLEVGKYLVEQGHESIVISNGGRLATQLEKEVSRHITLPVHKKRLSSLKQVKVLRKLFEQEKPDVLHLRSRLPAWLAYLAWRKMPPPHSAAPDHDGARHVLGQRLFKNHDQRRSRDLRFE